MNIVDKLFPKKVYTHISVPARLMKYRANRDYLDYISRHVEPSFIKVEDIEGFIHNGNIDKRMIYKITGYKENINKFISDVNEMLCLVYSGKYLDKLLSYNKPIK